MQGKLIYTEINGYNKIIINNNMGSHLVTGFKQINPYIYISNLYEHKLTIILNPKFTYIYLPSSSLLLPCYIDFSVY
jgi:hypothetical protein